MSHFDGRTGSAISEVDPRAATSGAIIAMTEMITMEDQLAQVIRSARDVAASAEELLRELALRQQAERTGRGMLSPLPVNEALQPLHVMRERLFSALEQLHPH